MARGWRRVLLGDVLTFQRGFDITRDQQSNGTYPVFSSSGQKSTHTSFTVRGPGVIVGRKGSLGTVFFSEGDYWPHDTTLWVKDFHGNVPKFAYYFLQTMGFERYDAGASNPTLNRNHIHTIPIEWPPVPVQHGIAETLSAYDDLIENNQRRMKILEEMARALYREWFGEFRFPGYERFKQKESIAGYIPRSWSIRKLKDIADVNSAQISLKNPPDEVHYIDIASVRPGQIDAVTRYEFADAPGRARRIVRHGDVLWSCVRPNRRSHALVMEPIDNTVASTGFAVLTATTVPFTFLYAATTTDDFVAFLANHATGAAYPAVTAGTFEEADILVPSEALLQRFGEATVPMAEQIHTLQHQNENLRRTRDLLLPRLMSGQISLDEPAA